MRPAVAVPYGDEDPGNVTSIQAREPKTGVVIPMSTEIVCDGCRSPYVLFRSGTKILCQECIRHSP